MAVQSRKFVYRFGGGNAEGKAGMKALLGGKGANLAEMANLGLPVPPGFTLTTEVCTGFYGNNRQYPDGVKEQVAVALAEVATLVGASFGDPVRPLLVSIRSGARASMPGMMDTVLNLGLNDQTVEGLASLSKDRRFAYDSYRRFIGMYSDVVLGVDHAEFEDILEGFKDLKGYALDTEISADEWLALIVRYKAKVEEHTGKNFPQDVGEQLWGAIGAVFQSWMSARAITYRKLNHIPEDWGTAVNVQAMVFGNMGETSATGVAFTRNPSTGEKALYGEFLVNAQGEDVVAGIRTPQNITEKARKEASSSAPSLEALMPKTFAELAINLTQSFALKDSKYTRALPILGVFLPLLAVLLGVAVYLRHVSPDLRSAWVPGEGTPAPTWGYLGAMVLTSKLLNMDFQQKKRALTAHEKVTYDY